MERRTLLRLMGITTAGGIAGCSGGDGDGGPAAEETETPADDPTADTETPMTQDTETPTGEETETESGETTETPAEGTDGDGLVTVEGGDSVEETASRIEGAIEDSPLNLMTTVDHAANAESVDAELPPTKLLIFGNPESGTPLMQESRTIAIDLPQKMLVWAENGDVKVTYNDPQYLANRHGIEGQDQRLSQIESVLDKLATGEE